MQADTTPSSLSLAYKLPDDAQGDWYVGIYQDADVVCGFDLQSFVERMFHRFLPLLWCTFSFIWNLAVRAVDWGSLFSEPGDARVGRWTFFSIKIPAGTPPDSFVVEYSADPEYESHPSTLSSTLHWN